MSALPFTRKTLVGWAGPQVLQEAETLVEKRLVLDVTCEAPWVRGTLSWCNRPMKTAIKMVGNGMAECACPCRDSRERNMVCAHAIALCLELIRRANHPERVAARHADARRAARLAQFRESDYLRRVKSDTAGAIPALLRLTLIRGWRHAIRGGPIPVRCEALIRGECLPLDAIARDLPLAFRPAEDALLTVLEDIAGGPAPGRIDLSLPDFANVLVLLPAIPLGQEEESAPITVHATRLASRLRIELDQATGELLLAVHTELPFARPGEKPLYFFAFHTGWVLTAENFWPLEQLLPDPLRRVYDEPIRIPRNAVPAFLQQELPLIAKYMRTETDVSPDLFTIAPAEPRFRLALRGSPASLAATLFADYGDLTLPAGKPDPAGHFATPDPDDLLRYTVRNLPRELQALDQLGRFGLRRQADDTLAPIIGCREVLNCLGSAVPAIRRMGWKVAMEGKIEPFLEGLACVTPVVNIHHPQGMHWFDVDFRYEDTSGQGLDPAEIQRALRKGDSFLKRGEQILLLDADAIQSMTDVFADCNGSEGGARGCFRLPAIYAAYVQSSLDTLDGVDFDASPDWQATARGQARAVPTEPVPLPPELAAILRPYQREGVQWLRHLEANFFGGILADEMGLGKTLQTLAWLQAARCHAEARGKPVLIVCPTTLVDNWAEEAQRFVPHMKILTLTGADRHGKWDAVESSDLVITSYALLRRDLEQYRRREFAVAALDEAQHIKNRSTQNAIAAKQIQAKHRIVLTGTPMENGVADLWSIMDFLMPGYLGAYPDFRRHYELPIAAGDTAAENAQLKLRRKLRPFLLRRLKTEVARDLPQRIERLAFSDLTPDQKAVYLQLLESSRRRLTDMVTRQGFQRSRMEVLKTLLRLRQTCCHLDLLRMPGLRSAAPSAKLELFFELLDEALDGGHRILVFSQFVSMLRILRQALEPRSLRYCYLDGATVERSSIIREFNTDRTIPLFLISLKAGGYGINLTGADMVIHFDPWWNPAVEDQATDRAHRIGQKRTVYSIKLLTRGTVEEKVLAMQQRKKTLINATLAPEAGLPAHYSWDDVLELLT